MADVVDLRREGSVFVLQVRAGENRINRSFLDAVNAALDEVDASTGNAALVTTGDGRYYSTGLDLEWLGSGAEPPVAFLQDVHRLFARVLVSPIATVAAINGHAFAAGAMLALAHDFRVMRSDRGFFCFPEVDLKTGQPLTQGMYALIDARLARSVTHEALVTGRRYTADEALEQQMVNEVAPEASVLSRAIEIAAGLAEKHRPTLGAIKRGLFAQALEALGEQPA